MPLSKIIYLLNQMGGSPIDVTHFIGDRVGASYAIAHFIMSIVDWLLGVFGLDKNQTLVTFLYASVVFVLSLGVGFVAQKIILWIVAATSRRWKGKLYELLRSHNFFTSSAE